MYNEESASLVLRTSDLPVNSSNNVGSADQFYTNMTWSNINLRVLLGSMYDKYDKFALVPVGYQSNLTDATLGSTADDRVITINLSGLPFTNNVYNSSSKTNQTSSAIYAVRIAQGNYISSNVTGCVLTFTKNQELVNFNIFYQRVNINGSGNYNVSTGVAFPRMVFLFNIYGITKSDRVEDLNSSRLF